MNDTTSFETTGGARVRVLDRGTGSPVVVLHGWGGRIESMAPVIDCLRSQRRVFACDLPGFGGSDPPDGAWGTVDYARLVGELLDAHDIPRADFVGHSFGAKTSIYLAATHPERVHRLVLVGSSGLTSPASTRVRAKRALSRTARAAARLGPAGRRFRAFVYDRIASQDYKDAGPMRATMVKVVNEDLKEMLPRVKAPTLLVWGTEDDAVPVRHARTMERLIPDAGLVLFEGAGHFAYLDEPDRFCRIARHFLDIR